ncbi:TetR/AcrR family transcriptional regulator [Streptomyces mirabilis]|uniref:TetR/AcrR family transcriptional regulator n=1 Tax=Streptomyces mirabilis TaxID=68239 RepID=UPI003D9EA2C9
MPGPVCRSAARDRLLRTAIRLFYGEGIRGVGVDRVMAEADVARGIFYRHFHGKDDLVRAYLDAADRQIRAGVTAAAKEIPPPPTSSPRWRTAWATRCAARAGEGLVVEAIFAAVCNTSSPLPGWSSLRRRWPGAAGE